MKACTTCLVLKEESEFNLYRLKRRSQCRNCQSNEGRIYYQRNREKIREKQRVLDGPGQGRWGPRTDPELPAVLNEVERQVIIGGLLGDGSLTHGKRQITPAYRERHGLAQENYLRWKGEMLHRMKPRIVPNASNIGSKSYGGWVLSTIANPTLNEFAKFYEDRKKIVPQEMADELGPLGLAVWLQDDGYLAVPKNGRPYMTVCSMSFTWEENEMLVDRIRIITGNMRTAVMKAPSGSKAQIYIGPSALEDVASLVAPFWHSDLKYKFPYPDMLTREKVD